MLYDKWLLDDLTQQGYLGLIEAYSKFDFKKGHEFFWRYAYKFVKGRMIEFTIQHYNIVRPSQKINCIILKIMSRNHYTHLTQLIQSKKTKMKDSL
ncbi:sigma factor [Paenibacillus sp. Z3-2]